MVEAKRAVGFMAKRALSVVATQVISKVTSTVNQFLDDEAGFQFPAYIMNATAQPVFVEAHRIDSSTRGKIGTRGKKQMPANKMVNDKWVEKFHTIACAGSEGEDMILDFNKNRAFPAHVVQRGKHYSFDGLGVTKLEGYSSESESESDHEIQANTVLEGSSDHEETKNESEDEETKNE
jgi:hypothetical protein